MEIALSACPFVHRHEPPVTSRQVENLQRDDERGFLAVDKRAPSFFRSS